MDNFAKKQRAYRNVMPIVTLRWQGGVAVIARAVRPVEISADTHRRPTMSLRGSEATVAISRGHYTIAYQYKALLKG